MLYCSPRIFYKMTRHKVKQSVDVGAGSGKSGCVFLTSPSYGKIERVKRNIIYILAHVAEGKSISGNPLSPKQTNKQINKQKKNRPKLPVGPIFCLIAFTVGCQHCRVRREKGRKAGFTPGGAELQANEQPAAGSPTPGRLKAYAESW